MLGANPRERCRLKPFVATAFVVAATAALCACGGGSGGVTSGLFSSSIFGGSTKMVLAPVIGPPPNVSKELSDDLVSAAKDRSITLLTSGTADYTMRGYLAASADNKGSKVSYVWDITDAKGSRVARVSGEEVIAAHGGGDPWSGVDSAALRSIAGKSTSQVAASLPNGGGSSGAVANNAPDTAAPAAATSPPAAAHGPVMALVSRVSGAPGDGSSSLTAALKKRLYSSGVKLAGGSDSEGRSVYTIKGNVSLTDAGSGKQNIRIDWLVLDPTGKKLGTVSQQNTIPNGSLNGPWGAIADAAAGAAADGIIKLLPKSS